MRLTFTAAAFIGSLLFAIVATVAVLAVTV